MAAIHRVSGNAAVEEADAQRWIARHNEILGESRVSPLRRNAVSEKDNPVIIPERK
jgi:hypothetical protein